MRKITKEEIEGYECKHVVYMENNNGELSDMLFVKELIHLKDKTTVPSTRIIKNFERPYWVTKPAARNHEFKKQFERLENLDAYKSTQIKLTRSIARTLRIGWVPDQRVMSRSQYLYGTDVDTRAIIKNIYKTKFNNLTTINAVAVCDLEADVVYGHEKVLSGSLTYKDRVVIVVTREFLGTIPDAENQIQEKFEYYLGEHKRTRGIKLEVVIVDNELGVVLELVKRMHAWQPDFVAFWNMAYDIPKMLSILDRYGVDPASVWCDPSVPPEYRIAKWAPGASMKITASGRKMALGVAERWNTFYIAAGFYVIDAMCVYQKIRVGAGKEPSYGLDAILTKELGIRKLKFEEASHLIGIGWHQFMQQRYKLEYLIYNIFDCISIELLDEKNMDLASKISMLSECSDYSQFPSQPRRTCNQLHFYALQNEGHVIGSTSDNMELELDKYVTSTEGWIVTLPTQQVVDSGLKCIEEFPELSTKIRLHVADIDVTGAYPTGEDILNISTETNYRELSKIEGCTEWQRRMVGINLTGGAVNATELCRLMYRAPTYAQLGRKFGDSMGLSAKSID